ncbi:MAG: hypothetical protein ACREQL_05585 [Candidatus Binatia bacterium]
MTRGRALGALVGMLVLLATTVCADDEVSNFQLMRPVWALGFADAGWLFDYRGQEKRASVAVFPLALAGVKEDHVLRESDATARLTRAIPLYVAERLFLETTCDVPVNMLVVRNQGPLVTADALTRDALVRAAGDPPPTVLVSGTLAREPVPLVRVTLEIQTTDGRRVNTIMRIGDEPTLNFVGELVDAAIEFVVDARLCERTKVPAALGRPPTTHVAPYVGALAQLLSQTFAEGHMMPVSSLWSEVGMMAWYERLRTELPSLLAPRLIELRGVLMSQSYGGTEYGARLPLVLAELEQADTAGNAVGRLAPLVYSRAGKSDACEAAKSRLAVDRDPSYAKWLAGVQCRSGQTQAR